jgi:hypothetical protein
MPGERRSRIRPEGELEQPQVCESIAIEVRKGERDDNIERGSQGSWQESRTFPDNDSSHVASQKLAFPFRFAPKSFTILVCLPLKGGRVQG